MPLTDLVRHLNTYQHRIQRQLHARSDAPVPFAVARGKVLAHFGHLQLASRFLPIVETASGQAHGHAASLQAFDLNRQTPLEPQAVFDLPASNDEFVELDRLVRTLHALNYLTYPVRGNLLLKVHPRHILSVPADHGLAFEEILRDCCLMPKQITLELEIDGIDATDHLQLAVANYKARGYHIAIHRFGRLNLNFALLERLRPEIVRLDTRLLENPETLTRTTRRLQSLGAKTLIEGIGIRALCQGAHDSGIDLLQAHAPLSRFIHAQQTPAAAFA
ncbi:MAG: EAL domain-containing protein [Zoogloeaceae bacterium]|jgi:EAL domain-containing protein (putative c-di-GMP-specific phosphodiesterase class I)|nr:EAL domain-containing protein [Zoogloeaceae bacterium]